MNPASAGFFIAQTIITSRWWRWRLCCSWCSAMFQHFGTRVFL